MAESRRRIFIGDIQGCLEPLQRLLEACHYDQARDVLHPVGDLVRKGPDSKGVLRLLRDLDAQPVLGNHDLHWLASETADSPDLARWLRAQPFVRVMDDVIMVHAGLHPRWSEDQLHKLTASQAEFAVTVRYCDPDGNLPPSDWPPPEAPYAPWDSYYRGDKQVVFGHWARRGLARTERVIGLDTGCCYGRELTAWIAEEDRIVQVEGQA